ncbi:MFS transporter [Candidatus Bathyarchaeota archaeon]|nr:MFS transporter [Candidatus Bathyarchaeota archaeon]
MAGVLVDRWNRKLVMMLSDIASGIATIAVFILFVSGGLEVWHLFVTGAFTGIFQSFQWPSYSATISLMVNKKDYARASGMLSLADSVSNICAPAVAGVLIGIIGVGGVLSIDIVTFLVAVGILLSVVIPQPPKKKGERKSILSDTAFGFRFIWERRPLLALQLVFFASNLIMGFAFTILTPMIMSRTGNDTVIMGGVQSAFGVGGVVGGLILSAWGGPKRRVNSVLLGMAGTSLLGITLLGLARTSFVWMLAAFLTMFFVPFSNGGNQAIWQSKVPPEFQGRVFSTRALIATISSPIAMIVAGPLADNVMTPAMMPGGSLESVFGGLVGVGSGAGMALIFVFVGVIGTAVSLMGYVFSDIRDVEKKVSDHDAVKV